MTTKKLKAKTEIKKIIGVVRFSEMLEALRHSKGMSQVEMADRLGISKQDLCNIEKGRKLVSIERAVSFAEALKMPKKTFAKYALQDQLLKAGLKGEVVINEVA